MAQWEKLMQLDLVYLQRLDELYNRDEFPMDVRQYLAHWIENQDWDQGSRDSTCAMLLFQDFLQNLDDQYSRFVTEGESFLLQRNFRRFKQNFQRFVDAPYLLANIIQWFMEKEREILRSAELPEQVQLLHIQHNPMETDRQRNIERKMAELRSKLQTIEHKVKCLEEQQDEFDFKLQTHRLERTSNQAEMNVLQQLLNRLDGSRKSLLSDLAGLLDSAGELVSVVVREELVEWQRRQQKACIGAPVNTSLEQLEKWFTWLAEGLFQARKFLQKLEELKEKVTYESDPLGVRQPLLQRIVDGHITDLLKSAFVVETQPSMPQGKGSMVLRTSIQFSVKTRFLVKFPELNHAMQVTVSIDRNASQYKGCRRFNVLGTNSKALNMAESMNGGMVADFRHLTLKEQKAGGGGKGLSDLSLSVTEELHNISFETVFQLNGLSVPIETSSLPVVIISNSSQQQSAWASILWFNMLCPDPKNVLFFAATPLAPWPQLGEMLSWQFLHSTSRGLDPDQLAMIARKLFGKQQRYDNCNLSWAKFNKENLPHLNFTFWVWFDGVLGLVKSHLDNLWRDGLIMGFVSKGREKIILKEKQLGTFLLRFSESSRDGAITFSWVDYDSKGVPNVFSVEPFTKAELAHVPLHETLSGFQVLVAENVPENPLRFLYPNTPKEEAFGKYCSKQGEANNRIFIYRKHTWKFVSTTTETKVEVNSPASCELDDGGGLNALSGESGDLDTGILLLDPMLPSAGDVLSEEAEVLHMLFHGEPAVPDGSDFPFKEEEDQLFTADILHGFSISSVLQACGNSYP